MIIKNGLVFTEDNTFEKKNIYIKNNLFLSEKKWLSLTGSQQDTTVLDARDCYVIPGLIDIHSHGAVGYDFSDGDIQGLAAILTYEYKHGITTYCPTTMSLPKEDLIRCISCLQSLFPLQKTPLSEFLFLPGMASVPGIHLEGPFLDPKKKGAHRTDYLCNPNEELYEACRKTAHGRISLLTLSPNLPLALSFIANHAQETTISLGHTTCDYSTALSAINSGATHITHLFNAMEPLLHRSPGLIGAALEKNNVYAELIADGIHVHDTMIRQAFRLFPHHICLISDSMRATGMPSGKYSLGKQTVTVNNGTATLSDGTIAGSVSNLFDCMIHAIRIGVPLTEAIAAATSTPAKSIGIFDRVGSITPGKKADVVILSKDFKLLHVL